ncbi:amidohydrolase [Salipiger bermudensis]|uniref:amidohydrolase n=1 Tax=Salipiger bermudensis TaxID=344736 RepID=UPI001CD65C93|nr:amidohydrolase [Salipiger bermudensis]MCA0963152.1 amidohydrolase [Salipiger bermudensis]
MGLLKALPALVLALAPLQGAAQSAALQDAFDRFPQLSDTMVYVGREILTLNPDAPSAEAVAVAHGRIIDVGTLDGIEDRLPVGSYAVDRRFEDKVIVPGFVEQHLHPLLGALTMMSDAVISIEDWQTPAGFSPLANSEEEFRSRLSEVIASYDATSGRPLMVWGYHASWHGDMNRAILDELAPDIPLAVWQRSTHEMFFNSVALEQLEITEDYIAGWPSVLARHQADLENGHFLEAAFWEHVFFEKFAPAFATIDKVMASLEYTEDYYHRSGITTLAEPAGPVDPKAQALVAKAFGPDDTPFNFFFIPDGRTLGVMHLENGGAEKVLAETEAMLALSDGRTQFLPGQIKLLLDGAIYSELMIMRDGYRDGHDGQWIMTPEFFKQVFDLYWDAGFQIHIHNLGDGGLDILLDTLEAAMQRSPRYDHRTVVVHFGYAQPDQIARIKDLGAIVSANAVYTPTLADRYAEGNVGKERTERMVPLGDAIRAGIPFSMHSDMPMAPAEPLKYMWAAVNRISTSGSVIGPDQRITAEEALKGITLGAAYSIQMEDEIGSIERGKLANFTILEENPLTVDPMALADIGVWGTVLEGRVQPAPAVPGGDSDETGARLIIDDPERVLDASLRHARSKVHHHDH